jgi:predicted O-methyltransferase YrrM
MVRTDLAFALIHVSVSLTIGMNRDGEASDPELALMRLRPSFLKASQDFDAGADETVGEIEQLVQKLVAEHNATSSKIWPFTSCDPLVDIECKRELPHEETASETNKKLFSAAFEQNMTVGPFAKTGKDTQVWHRDNMRSLDLISADPLLPMMRWSTLNCGALNMSKEMTCDAQPCTPSKDPDNLGLYKNFKEIVSVGPSVFGAALKKVALIGVGGGVLVHFLHQLSPDLTIDAVEYESRIADVAKSCFAFPTSPNVNLAVQDGYAFLESKPDGAYDWIIVDASGSLDRFGTPDAHKLYQRLLGDKGVVTFNTAGFEKFPRMVTQAALVAKQFWTGAFKTPRHFSWSFSQADLTKVTAPTGGNAFQKATTTWWGAGVTQLIPGWR